MKHRRAKLWDACIDPATGFVLCNLCGGRVLPGEAWHESHIGTPKAWGGNTVGIAHKICNEADNLAFVIPATAKADRQRRRHLGITGPGLSANPLPAGRRSNVTKTLNGKVETRLSASQKHKRAMAALYSQEFLSKE